MAYRSEPLDAARYRLDAFDSTEPNLDTWLAEHAAGAAARRVSRTFVWVQSDGDPDVVVGYYSLVAHVLVRDALPKGIGRGSPDKVPAILLGRLALDRTLHGQHLGGVLLADALGRAVTASENVGVRFVVVDALHNSAAAFYRHHGFTPIPGTLRLVQKISDIAQALVQD